MPSIYKLPSGKWRAQIRANGKSASKRFNTRSSATEWAYKEEKLLTNPEYEGRLITLSDAMEKYNKEESIHKPSYSRECKRTEFLKTFDLAKLPVGQITKKHINNFCVDRLKSVMPSTVQRDLNYLGVVFEAARRKWEYIKINPVHEADKPKRVPPRKQRISQDEIDAICEALGYSEDTEIDTSYKQVAVIFLIAIETAMRQGEITNLLRENIHDRSAFLPTTKNGESRVVPLSLRAVELLDKMPEGKRLFSVTTKTVSTVFRRIRRRLGYHHLRFHDSRREATSRLAKKFDVMMLAKITGHRDLKMLLNVYYAPKLSEFIDILDS